MKRLRVYLDTSVIGGCFDAEFATWSNALVADFEAERLTPVVSELVATEIQLAPAQVQGKFVQLLEIGAELRTVEQVQAAGDLLAQRGGHPCRMSRSIPSS